MVNIRLIVAYKGTAYAGWQIQPNAVTVQEKMSEAVFKVIKEHVVLYASGRTDAGVHAAGQVVNFFTSSQMPAERFAPALNSHLPKDIRVLRSEEVALDFHSQYSAHCKTYCYRIYTGEILNPFFEEYAWHIRGPLDINAMQKAGNAFVGIHDFSSFMNAGSPVKSTVREIFSLTVSKSTTLFPGTNQIEIFITGNGFLYNMVRIIAGTLVDVGSHKTDPNNVPGIIMNGDRKQAGITAPAHGLMLINVVY